MEFLISLTRHAQQVEGGQDDTKNREVNAEVENHGGSLLCTEDVHVQRGKERAFEKARQTGQRCQCNTRTDEGEVWPTNLCSVVAWRRQIHQRHATGANQCRDESATGLVVPAEEEQYGEHHDDGANHTAGRAQEYRVFEGTKDW